MRRTIAALALIALIGGGASVFKDQLAPYLSRWPTLDLTQWLRKDASRLLAAYSSKPQLPDRPSRVPIVAAPVASGNVPIYLRGIGTVIAYNTVVVRSQIQGQITEITFTEGQTVRKGDLLAQIDPRPYQAQIDQMVATRDRDQAQLKNALENLGRYSKLYSEGWATQQLLDTQKSQVAQLQEAVKSDQALIEAANVQLSYTRLTSPIDGVVGIRQIDMGNIISPSSPNGLVVVTQIQPISAIFTLPETDLPEIQQQQTKGQLKVLAYSTDDKYKLDEGQLLLVNNEINQTTGTLQIKANFANPQSRLWPGELINAWLLLEIRSNGLTIPESAVQRSPRGTYAYVINSDDTVELRPITVGQISQQRALVDSGLQANEQVVIAGHYRLQPGSLVTVLQGKAAQELAIQDTQQREQIP